MAYPKRTDPKTHRSTEKHTSQRHPQQRFVNHVGPHTAPSKPTSPRPCTPEPKMPVKDSTQSPRRKTWTRTTKYRWSREDGPLASPPALPTVHSRRVLGDERPRTPELAHLNKSFTALYVSRWTPSASSPDPRIDSQATTALDTARSSVTLVDSAQDDPPETRQMLTYPSISPPPSSSLSRQSRGQQRFPSSAVRDVRRPLVRRGPVSDKLEHARLLSTLQAGKDYLGIAEDDVEFCDRFPAQPRTLEFLKTDSTFRKTLNNANESRGLVISGNDRKYDGEPVSLLTAIVGEMKEGLGRFSETHPELKVFTLTYIAGRHAEPMGGGMLVGSVADMLRSLSAQLLNFFPGELQLQSEYLTPIDITDAYAMLCAFMTLLSSVATREKRALTGGKTRVVILIDGVNFHEHSSKVEEEYEEFFSELDELVIKINEGHGMDCFDPLRERWEAAGLKPGGVCTEEWKEFVRLTEMETGLIREGLVVKYVLIHPQVSRWKPRKYGGSIVLDAQQPIWI